MDKLYSMMLLAQSTNSGGRTSGALTKAASSRATHSVRRPSAKPARAAAGRPRVVVGRIHASWCGPCQALDPEWIKMAAILKSPENVRMGIAVKSIESAEAEAGIKAVNDAYLAASAEKLVLNSYPTIFTIDPKAGSVSYYTGARGAQELVEMARSAARAAGAPTAAGGGRRRRTRRLKSRGKRRRAAKK